MNKTVINILGEGRSGTTMLDLMLGSNSNAISLGEVYAFFRPWREHHVDVFKNYDENTKNLWSSLQSIDETQFHKKALEFTGKAYAIDSSKRIDWVIDNHIWNRKNNLATYNVLIWKSPSNSYHSFKKRNVSYLAWLYGYYKYHISILNSNIPFISIQYEELISNPQKSIQYICSKINMKYENQQELFWNYDHQHLFGSLGTRMQLENKSGHFKKGHSQCEIEWSSMQKILNFFFIKNLTKKMNEDKTTRTTIPKKVLSYRVQKIKNRFVKKLKKSKFDL